MPEPSNASKRRVEPGTEESDSNDQSRLRDKGASAEPALSEQGGIEPVERAPSKYHDRTRDRTLEES